MTKKGGLGMRFFIEGNDLSGDVGSISAMSSPRGVLDKTGINSSAMERVLTHTSGEITFVSHFNDAAGQEHPVLSALPATDVDVLVLQSATAGDAGWALRGKQINYDGARTADGDLQMTTQVLGNSSAVGLEDCKSVTAAKVTHASATSSASIDDNGVAGSSAQGGIGFIQVFSIGSGTPTFVLEDSPNDSVWATLISFGADAAATGDRITVTGNVDRYLRATTTGTFTNAVFAMAFRRGTSADVVSLA